MHCKEQRRKYVYDDYARAAGDEPHACKELDVRSANAACFDTRWEYGLEFFSYAAGLFTPCNIILHVYISQKNQEQ